MTASWRRDGSTQRSYLIVLVAGEAGLRCGHWKWRDVDLTTGCACIFDEPAAFSRWPFQRLVLQTQDLLAARSVHLFAGFVVCVRHGASDGVHLA